MANPRNGRRPAPAPTPPPAAKEEYDDTNRLTIFVSQNRKNPKSPSHFGFINVEGVEYRIALWPQVSKKTGQKYLSGAIQLREEEQEAAKTHEASGFSQGADEIPF